MESTFERVRGVERSELDRLETYLESLDADGWLEQSYDTEWRVYQVVSHLASQSLIYLGFLANWFEGSPPMTQEQMKAVWDKFNALGPSDMLPEFRQAKSTYLARVEALPPEAGLKEVNSPFGKVAAATMLAVRLHEVALHSWDVYVARDRT
ncbi:MAG: maleylpyruvate isomerase N-terminal domain-containing protein, partial [Chloroflexota bacterium]